jgi:hypothetical protein
MLSIIYQPNVTLQWFNLPLCIHQVLDLNLSIKAIYPDITFLLFSSIPERNCDSALKSVIAASFHNLSN